MKVLFVAGRPGAATGSSTYRDLILKFVLPTVEGAVYEKREDLDRQWDWIHVLDGKLIPPELLEGERDNLIVDVHDHYWCAPPDWPSPDKILRLAVQKKRRARYLAVLDRARRLFVHSEAVRAAIDHDDIHNVGLGVPPPKPPARPPERNHQVLLAGRDLFRKGVVPLIGAIRLVRKQFPDVELVIAGKEYPHSLFLTKLMCTALPVRFAGQCSREEMEELYATVGCVVLPSWIEAFGLVLIEGMARAVPVIAADAGGMPEVVSHRRTGQLFPRGDAAALARAIRTVWEEPDRAAEWVKEAQKEVIRRFSCETMRERILEAYRAPRRS